MPNLNHTVKFVSNMQSGVKLDLGERFPAYLHRSHASGHDIVVGSVITGVYDLRGEGDDRYAHITAISDVVAPATSSRASSDSPATRKLSRRVDGLSKMRTGLKLDLGHDAPAFVSYKTLKDAGLEINKGDQVIGSYQMQDGEYARIISVDAVNTPGSAAGPQENADIVSVIASGPLSANNRFMAVDEQGKKIVVQAMGRCVMYAKTLAKEGAELLVTGTVNSEIDGSADIFIDAVRVDKAAAA